MVPTPPPPIYVYGFNLSVFNRIHTSFMKFFIKVFGSPLYAEHVCGNEDGWSLIGKNRFFNLSHLKDY
jgi:hypothetical protein